MDEDSLREPTLPGFRFHPTEEELVSFYLNRAAAGIKLPSEVIGFLNIYHYDPCELPGMATIKGEREWYFFVHRDRRKGHGGRPNRTTKNGFWKATGSDRQIRSLAETKKVLGLRKTLVFYTGRAPRGSKTDWVMNEYRLPDNHSSTKEDVVLCKIYRKATSLKTIEERAVMEDLNRPMGPNSSPSHSLGSREETCGESVAQNSRVLCLPTTKEEEGDIVSPSSSSMKLASLKYCNWMELGTLDLPKFNMASTTDSLWAQFRSPCLDFWSPGAFTNFLNYEGLVRELQ